MNEHPPKPSTLFQKGQVANPKGRPKGSRDKVSGLFLNDLTALWAEQGDAVLRRAAFEKPMEFAAMVAKLLPAKLEITTPTQGMSLDEMERMIELAERMASLGGAGPSMTIEGRAVEVEGGRGSPQDGVTRGEVIEVVPSSAPQPNDLLVLKAPQPNDLLVLKAPSPETNPDFSAAPIRPPSSQTAETPNTEEAEEEVDPASLF